MPESARIVFTHKQVVEALVRKQGIHEGIWGLYVRFGINAANVGPDASADLLPAAIIPVLEIGLQPFEVVNNLSVDAAVANPGSAATGHAKRVPGKRTKASEAV
jgi:hypothetical protein